MKKRSPIRSDIAFSTPDTITVKGMDLCTEILGVLSLGDMAFLELTDRVPSAEESRLFNAIAVTLVEHGLSPSAITARLTYAGAPESLQAAVAAGLCGLGSVFVGSMEDAARMLQESAVAGDPAADVDAAARQIVARLLGEGGAVPGLGHHFHKPVDPRVPRLFAIAEECGHRGRYVRLMEAIATEAEAAYGKPLPVNATGAIAAIASELAIPFGIVRGIGVMARAIGLVGHIREEIARPIAREIKTRVEEEALSYHLEARQT